MLIATSPLRIQQRNHRNYRAFEPFLSLAELFDQQPIAATITVATAPINATQISLFPFPFAIVVFSLNQLMMVNWWSRRVTIPHPEKCASALIPVETFHGPVLLMISRRNNVFPEKIRKSMIFFVFLRKIRSAQAKS